MEVDTLTSQLNAVSLGTNIHDNLFRGVHPQLRAQICEFLPKWDAVLAGSFVCRYFFPNWVVNNIDIFTPVFNQDDYDVQDEELKVGGWEPILLHPPHDLFCERVTRAKTWRAFGMTINIFSFDMSINPVNFDLPAEWSRQAQLGLLQKSFDFDGCAVLYDGQGFTLPPMNIEDFLKRRWRIQEQACQTVCHTILTQGRAKTIDRFIDRLDKYETRGIGFLNTFLVLSAFGHATHG